MRRSAACTLALVAYSTAGAASMIGSGSGGPFTITAATQKSGCVVDNGGAGPGFTCNIFETDSGPNAEVSSVVSLPNAVTAGYLILLERPNSSQTDVTQWSDIAWFQDSGNGFANTLQFFSDPITFPSLAQILRAQNAFIVEIQTGTGGDDADVTVYKAISETGTNTYNFHSGAPISETDTPEPAYFALIGTGLIALAWLGRTRANTPRRI